MKKKKAPWIDWWSEYEQVDFCGGAVNYILDDDEDMIEINYGDGMLIDVGRASIDLCYYITVVSSDTVEGWRTPLEQIAVLDKGDLAPRLQETILSYRKKENRS